MGEDKKRIKRGVRCRYSAAVGGERERPGTEGVEHGKVATGSQKAARQQHPMRRRINGS